MKYVFICLLQLVLCGVCLGQATLGKVEYQKSQQPAAIIELPYSPELVEAALKDYLTKKGSKANQSKGFVAFKNVQVSPAEPGASDVYFKIDKRSRNENNVAIVYMLVAKPDENIATRSSIDNTGMEQAKSFLNSIAPSIISYNLEMQIKQQDEEVRKTEKRMSTLVQEWQDLDKRKRSIEERIQENSKEQEKQKLDIQKQKQALELLIAKRTQL